MVEVTHGDRIVYPADGWTKADVVAHYGRVAEQMLPHVRGRPLTLVRHRTNIDEKGFFQKSAAKHFPAFIQRIEVPKSDGVNQHASVTSREGLEYLANQGTIELHATLWAMPDADRPDRLVIDLDPPGADPELVRRAARHTRALLDALGIASTPSASGGKGYHVYVALAPTAHSHEIGRAAHVLATALATQHSAEMTIEVLKKNRTGRVFVDWMRNSFASTVIAPYSLRARARAPVAVPIGWDELDEIAPNHFTIDTIAGRLGATDPLLELAKKPIDARELCERCEKLRTELGLALVHYDRFGRPSAE
jgi:bifunctional non-homologous end joining protein LigD